MTTVRKLMVVGALAFFALSPGPTLAEDEAPNIVFEGNMYYAEEHPACIDKNAATGLARMVESGSSEEELTAAMRVLVEERLCGVLNGLVVIGAKVWGGDGTKLRVIEVKTSAGSFFVLTKSIWRPLVDDKESISNTMHSM